MNEYINSPISENDPTQPISVQRTSAITAICMINFILIPIAILGIFWITSEAAHRGIEVPSWLLPAAIGGAVINLVCMLGLWQMKRWGAIGWLIFAFADFILCVLTSSLSIPVVGIRGIIVAIIISQFSKLR